MKKIWILFLLMMTVLSVGAQSLLPVPEWTNTPAILKGQIIGYEKNAPEMRVQTFAYMPYDDLGTITAEIHEDGSFRMEVPMYATRQGYYFRIGPWYGILILTAGDSVSVTLDLKSGMPGVEYSLECRGPLAELNNELVRCSTLDIWKSYRNVHNKVSPMSPADFYDSVRKYYRELALQADSMDLKPITKEWLKLHFQSDMVNVLLLPEKLVNTENLGADFLRRVTSEVGGNTLMQAYSAQLPTVVNRYEYAFLGDSLFVDQIRRKCDDLAARGYNSDVITDSTNQMRWRYTFSLLGGEQGVVQDAIRGNYYSVILSQDTPLTEKELKSLSQLENASIRNYFQKKNERLKQTLEERKRNKQFVFQETTAKESEKFLVEITKKYAGQVILIDFWGTWCGPCRQAIKDFKENHEKLSQKGLVTIYVTDELSPEAVWKNMATGIPGVHYRIEETLSNEIFSQYGLTGWPSYLIIGKNGHLIYKKTAFHEDEMVETILRAIDEDVKK